MVETVQIQYPKALVTQLISQINGAVELFVERTFILDKVQDLLLSAIITDEGEDIITDNGHTLVAEGDTDYSFALPSDCLRLYKVDIRNSTSGLRIINAYEWRVEHGRIIFQDFYDRTQTLVGSELGIKIELHYYYTPTTMSDLTDTPSIPAKFHEPVLANVFEKRCQMEKDLRSADYWRNKFNEAVIDGKRFANDRMTSADVSVTPEYF